MLTGSYQNSIDAKNRLIIPAKFREEIGFKCIMTKGLGDYLEIYPMQTWTEQQKKLASLPRTSEKIRNFLRQTQANAYECEIDKQGRTVLPAQLRDLAHIARDLVTIGTIDRIEVWAKDVYEEYTKNNALSDDDLAEISDKYQV